MSTTTLTSIQRQALAVMHAFTGNYYVSSFFRKGKQKIWKLLMKNDKFVQTFVDLGLFNSATAETNASGIGRICLCNVQR